MLHIFNRRTSTYSVQHSDYNNDTFDVIPVHLIEITMHDNSGTKLLVLTSTKNSAVFVFVHNSHPLTKLSFFITCWNNFMGSIK